MAHKKINVKDKRKIRVRKSLFGQPDRPRLSIFRSNRYLYAQIIDDLAQKTLVSAHTLKEHKGCNKTSAVGMGQLIAEKAIEKKISKVVFDRGSCKYHGVIKEIADSARKAGLEF